MCNLRVTDGKCWHRNLLWVENSQRIMVQMTWTHPAFVFYHILYSTFDIHSRLLTISCEFRLFFIRFNTVMVHFVIENGVKKWGFWCHWKVVNGRLANVRESCWTTRYRFGFRSCFSALWDLLCDAKDNYILPYMSIEQVESFRLWSLAHDVSWIELKTENITGFTSHRAESIKCYSWKPRKPICKRHKWKN